MSRGMERGVSNLELSKKLKELGVKQESAFYWMKSYLQFTENTYNYILWPQDRAFGTHPKGFKAYVDCAAFTVAELGEMFPNVGCLCETHRLLDEWVCCYSTERSEGFLQVEQSLYADTEANARAKMLIHLIEHGIVKP